MVEFLLDHGANIELENDPEFPCWVLGAPLWVAAHQGRVEVVDLLFRRYAPKHSPEETERFLHQRGRGSGHPVLFTAVASGNTNLVTFLLNHNVQYESNWFNASPLLATASFNRPAVTKVLLDYHQQGKINGTFDLNQRARNDRTAFIEACCNGCLEVGQLLLSAGAAWNLPVGKRDQTALHVMCHEPSTEMVSLLLEKAQQDLSSQSDSSQKLAAYINSKNLPEFGGGTPLINAAERDRATTVTLLIIKHNADYTLANKDGFTALHFAVWRNNESSVLALLRAASHDADPSIIGDLKFTAFLNHRSHSNNRSALVDAAFQGFVSLTSLLLNAYNAEWDSVDAGKCSALHHAVGRKHYRVAKVIVEYAAKKGEAPRGEKWRAFLAKKDLREKNVLEVAEEQHNKEMIELLREYGAG
ncbi:hypothetical protein MMC28_007870 [Mycoblastus sanguinarius]|nr:hypothetical protein [Mycoblastus sanguinarius]